VSVESANPYPRRNPEVSQVRWEVLLNINEAQSREVAFPVNVAPNAAILPKFGIYPKSISPLNLLSSES